MRNISRLSIALSAAVCFHASATRALRPLITTQACEAYLLSKKGQVLTNQVRTWLALLPSTSVMVDHVPSVRIEDTDDISPIPTGFFSGNGELRSADELLSEFASRKAEIDQRLVGILSDFRAMNRDEAEASAQAFIEKHSQESLTDLERAALGVSPNVTVTLGDIHNAVVSSDSQNIYLKVFGNSGQSLGEVDIPIESLRLGFKNSIARWQTARFVEDPKAFGGPWGKSKALQHFFEDQGQILLEKKVRGIRIGYLFEYAQTKVNPNSKYLHIRVVTVRDCNRPVASRSEIIFPQSGLASEQLNLCLAETELTLHNL